MAVKLTDYPSIENSYGGHQLWWGKGSVGHHFGCGVIAGLDGLIYRGVIGSETMSKVEYLTYAEDLWQCIRPNTGLRYKQPRDTCNRIKGIGVYSVHKLLKGINKYLKKHHQRAEFRRLSNRKSFWLRDRSNGDARSFIETALSHNSPVHLLSWKENQEGYNFHWITVTGIEPLTSASTRVTIATWGQQKTINNFESFWHAKGLFDYKVMVTYDLQ